MIQDYLSWSCSRKSLSNRSYNNYCMFLSTLFDFFKFKGFISENPTEGLERKKVDRKIRVVVPPADRVLDNAYFRGVKTYMTYLVDI